MFVCPWINIHVHTSVTTKLMSADRISYTVQTTDSSGDPPTYPDGTHPKYLVIYTEFLNCKQWTAFHHKYSLMNMLQKFYIALF